MSNHDLASHAASKNNRRPFGRSALGFIAVLSVAAVSAVIVRVSLPAEGQGSAAPPAASERACAELVSLAFKATRPLQRQRRSPEARCSRRQTRV